MLTNEQVREIADAILNHKDAEEIILRLEDVICAELELKGKDLLNAIIDNDADAVVTAFTGWCMESLFEKAKIIPHRTGSWPSLDETGLPDTPVFTVFPWEQKKGGAQ